MLDAGRMKPLPPPPAAPLKESDAQAQPHEAQSLQLRGFPHHSLTLGQPGHRIADHFIDDDFGALLLVDHGGGLAHQERPCIVHGVIVKVVA